MCSHKLVPYQRHFWCKFSTVGPVKQIQYKMAAFLFYGALIDCSLFSIIVPSCFSAYGALWCAYSASWKKIYGRHLDFQHVMRSGVLQLWYLSFTNTDGRHLDFQHVVRSGDLQLCYLSKQLLMAAILIFSTWCAPPTNTNGRHLDFQHVVRSGDLQLCYLS